MVVSAAAVLTVGKAGDFGELIAANTLLPCPDGVAAASQVYKGKLLTAAENVLFCICLKAQPDAVGLLAFALYPQKSILHAQAQAKVAHGLAVEAEHITPTACVVGGGTAKDSVEAGIAAYTAKTDAEAIAAARELLAYIPSNNEEGGAEVLTNDEVNRHIAAAFGDAASLVKSFADDAKYIELYADYAKSMSVGLISLAGVVCGIVATNPAENEGRLTSAAARKAAKFISFCDCFQIPVITLVDSEGFSVCGEEEKNPFCAEIGKLAGAYAMARTPLITLVSGAAYGSVFSVLGSKAIGADIVFAVDTAKIGCLSAKSAVALLWNDQITKDTTRGDLEAKWDAEVATAVAAARAGEIDDIVEAVEIRQRLASAVLMLSGKSVASPRRRHANMPL